MLSLHFVSSSHVWKGGRFLANETGGPQKKQTKKQRRAGQLILKNCKPLSEKKKKSHFITGSVKTMLFPVTECHLSQEVLVKKTTKKSLKFSPDNAFSKIKHSVGGCWLPRLGEWARTASGPHTPFVTGIPHKRCEIHNPNKHAHEHVHDYTDPRWVSWQSTAKGHARPTRVHHRKHEKGLTWLSLG